MTELDDRLDKAILAIYDIRIECYEILKDIPSNSPLL